MPVDGDDPRPAAVGGYLSLEHVAIREQLGLLTRPVEEERAQEEASIARLRDACIARGLLRPGDGIDATVEALHRWMSLTPSRMLAVTLADVVGDLRAVNQPAPTTNPQLAGAARRARRASGVARGL